MRCLVERDATRAAAVSRLVKRGWNAIIALYQSDAPRWEAKIDGAKILAEVARSGDDPATRAPSPCASSWPRPRKRRLRARPRVSPGEGRVGHRAKRPLTHPRGGVFEVHVRGTRSVILVRDARARGAARRRRRRGDGAVRSSGVRGRPRERHRRAREDRASATRSDSSAPVPRVMRGTLTWTTRVPSGRATTRRATTTRTRTRRSPTGPRANRFPEGTETRGGSLRGDGGGDERMERSYARVA